MTHFRTCNLCEAMCGLEIETDADKVVSIRGDKSDAFSRGYICPKATALGDIHHDPDRLKRPLKRVGDDFVEVSWDEAYNDIAARLVAIKEAHGPRAVAMYSGNPVVHNWGATLFGITFIKSLGSQSRFSATSLDQLPKMLAALEMFGHQLLLPVPDVDHTDYFVIFGANPVVSNGSIMSAPGMKRRIKAIRERGGKVVVFDPRRTETAELADEHIFVRPGTDAFVLLAMLNVIEEEDLFAFGHLGEHLDGLHTIREIAGRYRPEDVAEITGVPADTLRAVARAFATTTRAVIYGRVGVSMQSFGALSNWLIEVLNIVTAHCDREGGAMFTLPAVDVVQLSAWLGETGHHGKYKSRVRGAPEFGGELPTAVLSEEIETPGEGQIRALITHAGNPVLSAPNGRRLDRALARLEFMVAIDIYVNETTRHADYILPPTAALEHDNYDVIFHALAVRNTAKYSPALFQRHDTQRHDWEIFLGLMQAMQRAKGKGGFWPLLDRITSLPGVSGLLGEVSEKAISPRAVATLLTRLGPHGIRGQGLRFEDVVNAPHGIDLGALTSVLPGRIYHKNKRIQLAPQKFVDDLSRLDGARAQLAGDKDTLLLIGRRQLRGNNSWCHNSERLVKGPDRCTLLMHPQDSKARNITTDDRVRITSRVGHIEVTVVVSDEVMPGVVSLPHGFGHNRKGTRWRVAEAHAGESINDITDDEALDELAGTVSFSGVPVTVALCDAVQPSTGEDASPRG